MESDLKKTGYSLLAFGIIMILGAVAQMILVFTGALSPAPLFQFESSDFALDGSTLFPQLPASLTQDLKVELFPAQLINATLNLAINAMLMWIVIFAGGKIASLGVKLLRPVYVKMKVSDESRRPQEQTHS